MQLLFVNRLRLGLLVGLLITALLLLMWQNNVFQTFQLRLTDVYFVDRETSGNIVIVALDDASLQRFGRTPSEWSRSVYADAIQQLVDAEVRVMAFDLIFAEEAPGDNAFQSAALDARTSDARTRFVMAGAGFGRQTTNPNEPVLQFQQELLPLPSYRDIIDYVGFVNDLTDRDNIIRRQPSVIIVNGERGISFSLATALAYLRIPSAVVESVLQYDGNMILLPGERQLAVDDNGFWLQNFYGQPSDVGNDQTFPMVSISDVVDGNFDVELFNDKIVLFGLVSVAGDADRYGAPTDSGGQMAGVEIQANAIETILDSNTLTIRAPSQLTTALLIVVLTVGSTLIYIYPKWYYKLMLAFIFVVVLIVVVLQVFNLQGIITSLLYPILGVTIPALVMTGLDASREFNLRRRSEFFLESLVEVSEQRFQTSNILPIIAADIERILPGSQGAIFLPDEHQVFMQEQHTWGSINASDEVIVDLVQKVQQASEPVVKDMTVALPIWWQGQTLGVVVTRHHLAPRRARFLQDFCNRLAPSFENAVLFNEVTNQRSTLSTVLGNIPSAVLALDDEYRIRLFNEKATQLFNSDKLDTKSLIVLLSNMSVPESEQGELLTLLQNEKSFRDDIQLGTHSYNLDAALIPSVNQWVMVFTDVTELIELSNLKTRMLRMASHDLKNPLGRINGYAQLIEMRNILDEKGDKYLGFITDAVEEMNSLILDILDLERMRSGNLNMERFSFREMVEAIIRRHEPDATARSHTYTHDVPLAGLMVQGDVRQLSQVVSNLIGNAIKYTPEEGIISVRVWQDGDRAHFEVQDNGYGISKEAQEKLFTEFYRVRTEQTAKIAGTGLGLSLVKSVVDAHGGQVGVESEEGAGSRFYVDLPLAKETTQTNAT